MTLSDFLDDSLESSPCVNPRKMREEVINHINRCSPDDFNVCIAAAYALMTGALLTEEASALLENQLEEVGRKISSPELRRAYDQLQRR